jgi:23S rRNA (guanosine2251-2'-O)-methyltransferase
MSTERRSDPRSSRDGATGRGGGQRTDGGRRAAAGRRSDGGRQADAVRTVHGIHPVRELLRAGRPVQRINIAEGRSAGAAIDEIVSRAQAAGVPIERVAPDALDALAPGAVHQGVVAIAPPFPLVDVARLLAHAEASGRPPLLVAVDGVTDPHNFGSIARTAEAVGAHGLILPERRSAAVTPAAEKAAAGALAHLPVAGVVNLSRALEELGRAGVWSLGLDGDAPGRLAVHPLASGPVVLVVGAEGGGLGRLVRERCDALVSLPMLGRVGSLNASVAAGVALYTLLAAREAADRTS